MKKQNVVQTTSRRQEQGDKLIQLASNIDTHVVSDRLAAFTEVHRSYVALQHKVEEAMHRHLQEINNLSSESNVLNDRIDDVAVALVVERRQLRTPFAAYTPASPSVIKQMPPNKRQRIALNLVAAMRADVTLSSATLAAVTALEEAAIKFANLLGPLTKIEGEVVAARHERDREGRRWDKALKALRISARLAADDGFDTVYATLFATTGKSRPTNTAESGQAATGDTITPAEATTPSDTSDVPATTKAA